MRDARFTDDYPALLIEERQVASFIHKEMSNLLLHGLPCFGSFTRTPSQAEVLDPRYGQ